MKYIFAALLITAAASIVACNDDKSASKEVEKVDSSKIFAEQKRNAVAANEKVMADLEKLTPLTEGQLKDLLPATLMGATLSDASVSSTLGAAVASGTYNINDSTSLSVNIYDCAGPGGAGIYNLQFAGLLDYSTDNPTEYTKVIDFKGGKAIEHCKKASMECSLTYFTGSRFLISLEGNNVSADELKNVTAELKTR